MLHIIFSTVFYVAFLINSTYSDCFHDGKIFHCSNSSALIDITEMSLLNLSHSDLIELPLDTLRLYHHITDLDLNSNLLRMIDNPKSLSMLPLLQHLDLSNNSLIFMNFKIFKYNHALRTLILNDNHDMLLSPSTAYLPTLEELHLENCGIDQLKTSTFRGFTGLKVLNIQWNLIMELPNDFYKMVPNVNDIMFKGNPILEVPQRHSSLFNLRKYVDFQEMDDVYAVKLGLYLVAIVCVIIYFVFCRY